MFDELRLLPVGLDPPGPKMLEEPGPFGLCPNPLELLPKPLELLPDPLCDEF
jgi:hypothetical protein